MSQAASPYSENRILFSLNNSLWKTLRWGVGKQMNDKLKVKTKRKNGSITASLWLIEFSSVAAVVCDLCFLRAAFKVVFKSLHKKDKESHTDNKNIENLQKRWRK